MFFLLILSFHSSVYHAILVTYVTLSPAHLLSSVSVNPFLCLRLQFKSSLPVPRASQSVTLYGPISLFQIQLLLYTEPQYYISKEKRKPNMYMISFIIIKTMSTLRMLVSKTFHSSKFHQIRWSDRACLVQGSDKESPAGSQRCCTLVIHAYNSMWVKKLWQQ